MRAMVMTATGGPEVLAVQERPVPERLGNDQVLVRLHAAGINPIDVKLRQRGGFGVGEGSIPGCDGAGVVTAVGAAVNDLGVGDAVAFCQCGFGDRTGTYADYVVVPASHAVKLPDGVDMVQAAALPLVLITAWEALFDRAGLKAGQRVLVQGGAGGVGHVAVQLAASEGARVCATVSSADKAELVRGLGAEETVNYREQAVSEAVIEWSAGGVDVAFDTVGGEAFGQCLACAAPYADVVSILQFPDDTDWAKARLGNLRLSQELMLTPMLQALPEARAHQVDILRQGLQRLSEGSLRVQVQRVFGLEQAAEAHRLLEAGGLSGKLVLDLTG